MKQVQDKIQRKSASTRHDPNENSFISTCQLSTTTELRGHVWRLTTDSIRTLIPLKIMQFSTQRHHEDSSKTNC